MGANLAVELSGRRPSGEVLAHHGWFVANAFVATPPYMLVSADDGTVFGQPNLAYHRPGSQVVASASLVGVQFASLLTDGRWLVTSSGPVIAHPQLVVQRAPAADAGDVYWTHRDGLEILARRGLDEVDHGLAPLDVVLTLERIEQNRLRAHRDAGGSLWSLAREAQRGNAGTLADGAAVELAA